MQTVKVEISNESALRVLQDLHEKHFIKSLSEPGSKFFALPGELLNEEEFKDWVTAGKRPYNQFKRS